MLPGDLPRASEKPELELRFSLVSVPLSLCFSPSSNLSSLPPFPTAWILPSTNSRLGVHFQAPTFSAAVPRISTATS